MEKPTLRTLRLSKNISVQDAADEIGVTYMYMYMIERGARNPGDKAKRKIANQNKMAQK